MSASTTFHRTPGGTPVWITGSGPPVVLVHGVTMDHRMWAAQAEALAGEFRVCTLDMLCHGGSPAPAGPLALDDFVGQVHEVVVNVCGGERPVLGGFSMGGLVAQAYAVSHAAALRALVLMNTVYARSPEQSEVVRRRNATMAAEGVEGAVASAEARWFSEAERTGQAPACSAIVKWMREGPFEPKVEAHRVFATADSETAGRLGAITCPTLVLTGEDDAGSTPEMARRMAEEIPGARLEIVPGQRHMMPVLDAGRVNRLLLDFLRDSTTS